MKKNKFTSHILWLEVIYENLYKEVSKGEDEKTKLKYSLDKKFLTLNNFFKNYKKLNYETYLLLFKLYDIDKTKFLSYLNEKKQSEYAFVNFLELNNLDKEYYDSIVLFDQNKIEEIILNKDKSSNEDLTNI